MGRGVVLAADKGAGAASSPGAWRPDSASHAVWRASEGFCLCLPLSTLVCVDAEFRLARCSTLCGSFGLALWAALLRLKRMVTLWASIPLCEHYPCVAWLCACHCLFGIVGSHAVAVASSDSGGASPAFLLLSLDRTAFARSSVWH